MNGVHDMGGMYMGAMDLGAVSHEENEPVFHHAWEGRVYALNRAAAAGGKWNLDAARYEIELIPPADYLRMTYYERWYVRLVELLVKRGMLTRTEIESGKPAEGSTITTPLLTPADLSSVMAPADPERPQTVVAARFTVGQHVRALNIHPVHHTRLPRYARGKRGVIHRHQGVFLFPDTSAHSEGEHPQHVYSVRFAAQELWGPQASQLDSVHLDMWDSYLEPT